MFQKFLATLLISALVLTSAPAFALRGESIEGAGLEEMLTRALQGPDKAIQHFTRLLTLPPTFAPILPTTSGLEELGIPSKEDLFAILKKEKATVLYPKVGDPAFVFLMMLEAGAFFGLIVQQKITTQKEYMRMVLNGQDTSLTEEQVWRFAQSAAGMVLRDSDLRRLAKEWGLTKKEFLQRLGIPPTRRLVVVDPAYEGSHKTLFEETLHILEGPSFWHGRMVDNAEKVNDLLQLLFFPRDKVGAFRSGYTHWTDPQKIALQKRYLEEKGLNPNVQMRSILEALLDDLQNKVRLSVGEEQVSLSYLMEDRPQGRLAGRDTIRYLKRLLKVERFSRHQPLFPHWTPASTTGLKESGGMTLDQIQTWLGQNLANRVAKGFRGIHLHYPHSIPAGGEKGVMAEVDREDLVFPPKGRVHPEFYTRVAADVFSKLEMFEEGQPSRLYQIGEQINGGEPWLVIRPAAGLEEEFLKETSGRILEALQSTGPVVSFSQLFPHLIEEADQKKLPGAVPQALLAAFRSLQVDSQKRRLTGSLGQAMMMGLHEFSEDFEPDPYPSVLPGRTTIWTVTTSPTIDIDAKKKLANWSDRKGVLVDPGGGGINVAIALARRGVLARPVFFYTGETGKLLVKLIENRGVFVHQGDAIELKGNEQTRVTIVTSLDKAGSLVPKGTPVDEEARQQMVARLLDPQEGVKAGDIVAISGSLAPGLPDDFYADLGKQLVARGAIVVVDTKGAPAKAVLLSKPAVATIYSQNNLEFGDLVGVDPTDRKALIAKAQEILKAQSPDEAMREIVITEGAGGAFSVTREKVLEIPAPKVEAVSEVGAGDTSLAERLFRLWQGKEHDAGFVYGVAAGTASVLHPGTGGGLQAEVDHYAEHLGLAEETTVNPPHPAAGLEEENKAEKEIPIRFAMHVGPINDLCLFMGLLYREIGKDMSVTFKNKSNNRELKNPWLSIDFLSLGLNPGDAVIVTVAGKVSPLVLEKTMEAIEFLLEETGRGWKEKSDHWVPTGDGLGLKNRFEFGKLIPLRETLALNKNPPTTGLEERGNSAVVEAGQAIRDLPELREAHAMGTGYLLLDQAAVAALMSLQADTSQPLPLAAVVNPAEYAKLMTIAEASGLEESRIRRWAETYLFQYFPGDPVLTEEYAIESARTALVLRIPSARVTILDTLPQVMSEFGRAINAILRSFGINLDYKKLQSLVTSLYQAAQA